jgi:hypothetical protein
MTRHREENPRTSAAAGDHASHGTDAAALTRHHMRIGWWGLLLFLGLGILLEAFHGFKIASYLAAENETRRLLWTLSHAHGTLLSLVNIAFALSSRGLQRSSAGERALASRCLFGATIFLPAGFFLGGAFFYAGDPGPGVLLVPLGALLLAVAVFITARAVGRPDHGASAAGAAGPKTV